MMDMSWMGLYKRGIKLQVWLPILQMWETVYNDTEMNYCISMQYKFRYKHSIQ